MSAGTTTSVVPRPTRTPRDPAPVLREDDRAPFAVRAIGWVLTVTGAVGALAAFTLAVEKIKLLEDPGYTPTCSLNPVLSCGSVMNTPQAAAFGFPNPLIGVAAFAALTAVGVLVLAGARPPRWVWLGVHAGTAFGVLFAHWLIFQSLYRIGALCPYCMVVWVVTITAFWYTTLHNLHRGHLPGAVRWHGPIGAVVRYHSLGLTLWLLTITGLVGEAFWTYWRTLL